MHNIRRGNVAPENPLQECFCDGGLGSPWFPATASRALVGLVLGSQDPVHHWVRARPGPGDAEEVGSIAPGLLDRHSSVRLGGSRGRR